MAGLFSYLDLGAGALLATNQGVGVVGHNVANAGTEGFARQRVDFSAIPGTPIAGGVQALGPTRITDQLLTQKEWNGAGEFGRAADLARALSSLEIGMGTDTSDLVQAIAQLFGGIMELQAAPVDTELRNSVVDGAGGVANRFRSAALAVQQSQYDADANIESLSATATGLASQIAGLNREIDRINPSPDLLDQRDLAARQLTEIVGGRARVDEDGLMRFVLDGGGVLVDGERAASLQTSRDEDLGGHVRLDLVDGVHVDDVTSGISSGRLGGQLTFRDSVARDSAERLDNLAYEFATRFNDVHRNNAALDGSTGHDFFTEPGAVEGAALGMSISASLEASSDNLAAAAPSTGPGDTTGLSDLLNLRDQKVLAGGSRSLLDESIDFLSDLGARVNRATSDEALEQDKLTVLSSLRDSLSGVSVEEEMTKLSALQHAQEASVRFIATVDSLLGQLIEQV